MDETTNKFEDNYEIMMKEIDLIQDIIKRMAHNSFLIKGWTLTLVVASLLLKNEKILIGAIFALFPLISLWVLDAKYLQTEKKYIELYKKVIRDRKYTRKDALTLDISEFNEVVPSLPKIMFSHSLLFLYCSILLLLVSIIFFKVLLHFNVLKIGG